MVPGTVPTTVYPIFDSYVYKMLLHWRKQEAFHDFKPEDLMDYPKYCKVLLRFRKYFGLEEYNLKQIDRYLWQAGKEIFPNNYSR